MSVRFTCECGKKFTARNDFRGKHIQCPVCHSLISIPGRRSLLSFLAAPRTSNAVIAAKSSATIRSASSKNDSSTDPWGEDYRRASHRRQQQPSDQASASHDPADAPLKGRAASIRLRHPPRWEKLISDGGGALRWYHSISYPLIKVPVFCWQGVALSIITAVGLVGWVSIDRTRGGNGLPYTALGLAAFFAVYVLGTTCTYFNSMLALAARGKVKLEPNIDTDPVVAAANCGLWLACFLAGPVFVVALAGAYWVNCGELVLLDWVILAELGAVTIGWWLFAILLSNAAESFFIPLPPDVLNIALQLRARTLTLILPATAAFAGNLLLASYALENLHDNPLVAILLLSAFWGGGLLVTSMTLRRLGLAYCKLSRSTPA